MKIDEQLLTQLQSLKSHVPLLRDIEKRIDVLKRLKQMVAQHEDAICEVISQDFRYRSPSETKIGEIFPLFDEISHTIANMQSWLKPRRKAIGPIYLPASGKTVYQPLGVVGIIVPWNYPLFLAFSPLVGAIAAGNCCMVKMSDLSPNLGALLAKIIPEHFPEQIIQIVNGDVEVATQFTHLPFNYLLFTGSSQVGKKIMAAASNHLTPVTLELGGKSPAIIDNEFSMAEAATCIIRGKLLNAGQTCVAPDYVFVPKQQEQAFIEAAQKAACKMYPTLATNPDYSAIINEKHWQRLQNLVQEAKSKGAQWIPLSEDIEQKSTIKFQPGLLLNVSEDMTISKEEIFGPILIIKPYTILSEAIDYINSRPNPLALYCFTRNKSVMDDITANTLSGTLSFNETIVQIVQNNLPFGGVGQSGMGHYHGRYSIQTFSKLKPVYTQGRIHPANILKPPYGKIFNSMLKVLTK